MAGSSTDWEVATLGELGHFRNGVNFSQDDYGEGYPIINVKQLYRGRFAEVRDLLELRQSSIRNLGAVQLRTGDILFARSSVKASGAGQVAMVGPCPHNTVFSGFIIRFRVGALERAAPSFLNYVLRSPVYREILTRIGSGTTITNLSQDTLAGIAVDLPPLPEQRAIAHILGTLDDKIELNRRMNETLEAMARALFKSWFVDFDPVRAKAEDRDPGLPKPLADLFPDSFGDSELGEIPKGWEVQRFADTVDIIGGGTPKTSVAEYWNGDIPWFSVVDAPSNSEVWVVDTAKKITCEGVENSSTRVLSVGTTIISARGTVGRIALVAVPMAMNQSCYGLRGKSGTRGFFTYYATRELVARLQQHAHGSVFDTITQDTLAGVSLASPPAALIEAFEARVGPALERIRASLLGSRTLAALRDTLLPKLISGELRVRNADRFDRRSA